MMDESDHLPNTSEQDDSQVLKRLKTDGAEELPRLFDRLRPSLKSMIAIRLDRRLRSRIDESDIVQETFLRAANSLKAYLESPEVHPVIWLRLIAKHLVVETHRRHFRLKRSPLKETRPSSDSSQKVITCIAAALQPVHTKLANDELFERVRLLFKTLRAEDREILEMRHTDGLKLNQIADLLGGNYEATKKRYYRALSRFRLEAKSLIEEDSDTKVTRSGQIKR